MAGRIVVGVDGSELSARALEWAVGRATLMGAGLELVHAYTVTPDLDFFGYRGFAAGQRVQWLTEFSEEVLKAASGRVRELAPDLSCTTTSKLGHPVTLLTSASEGADMLVVGRRGLGGAASVLLGSVSNRLAVETKCPLVVIGDGETPATGPVVVGVDASDFGSQALRFAIAEATARQTSVRVVAAYEVVHHAFQADPELLARMRAGVEADTAETVARVLGEAQEGASTTVAVEQVVIEGRPAEAILESSGDAQLIVVGTHGKGMVRRIMLGSVSRQVMADADLPVVLVDLPHD